MRDLYRGERRRRRADALLIARKVDRATRRRIWSTVRFTTLSRALLGEVPELWLQVFGVRRGWTKADERRAREAASRRAQRERMARHQQRARVAAAAREATA